MTAREHRSEIIVLVALVVATALGLGVGVLVTQEDETGPSSTADSTAAPSEEPTASPTTDTTPAPAAAIAGEPFVYACRLAPRADVERIFGAFGPDAVARQVYLTRTPKDGEPIAPATRSGSGSGITTSCDYTVDDAAGHTLEVDVSQFPPGRALQRRWSALSAAGDTVARTDEQMVSLPSRRSFAMRVDPVLVEVRYSTFGDLARDRAMSARERSWQERRMRAVRATVTEHLADGSAFDGPAPVNSAAGSGPVPYLAPCAVLTDESFVAAGGPVPAPVTVDTSYVARDPFTDVPVASCERRGRTPGSTTFEVLEVRVTGSGAEAREAQAKHLANRYPRDTDVREVTTAAGTAYVVDIGGRPQWPWRTRAVHVVAGPYEILLSVLRDVTEKRPYGRWADDSDLVAAADMLVRDLTSEGGSDVP